MYYTSIYYSLFKKNTLGQRLLKTQRNIGASIQLQNNSRIAVIGAGPAGTLFSYFTLRLAERIDLEIQLDIFEPRHFNHFGPAGCNHCGGIVSESLVQILAMDGIHLPPEVLQRGIDSYVLHTDAGTANIDTPLHEKRIASVYRGGGPKTLMQADWKSFDAFLLELAQKKGANLYHELITKFNWWDGKPQIASPGGVLKTYDLVVFATGVNSRLLETDKNLRDLKIGFKPPITTTAFISEFHLGYELIQQYLGSAMHVFLLDIPRLKFAAIIPKKDFVTVCLLGKNVDANLVQAFFNSKEVQDCFPPSQDENIANACHCLPRLNIRGSPQPFADRILFIGDAGISRLYKDGIGAAYRTAKAAANAVILDGIAASDLSYHFQPTCAAIHRDNMIGTLVFGASNIIQRLKFSRHAILRMVTIEQNSQEGTYRPMSLTLWDLFTGSSPYKEILIRTLHPYFILKLIWNLAIALFFPTSSKIKVPYDDNELSGKDI